MEATDLRLLCSLGGRCPVDGELALNISVSTHPLFPNKSSMVQITREDQQPAETIFWNNQQLYTNQFQQTRNESMQSAQQYSRTKSLNVNGQRMVSDNSIKGSKCLVNNVSRFTSWDIHIAAVIVAVPGDIHIYIRR